MEKRNLGRTGMAVTVVGFGGSEIGNQKAPLETVDRLLSFLLSALGFAGVLYAKVLILL